MTANISGYTVISPVTGGILRIHEHITVCGVGVDKPRILVLLFIFQLWSPLRKVDSLYHIWKPFTSSFQVKRYLYTSQQNFSAFWTLKICWAVNIVPSSHAHSDLCCADINIIIFTFQKKMLIFCFFVVYCSLLLHLLKGILSSFVHCFAWNK